jgi:type I restriction enzyme S subunit
VAEWTTVALTELAAPGKAAMATGPFGSAVSSKNFRDSGVPMLRGSNLSDNVATRLNEADLVFLDAQLADGFARSTAHRNDLVFTCWGTIGQIGFIDESAKYESYVVSNKQMKMTPDREKVDPLFLYYLLSEPRMVDLVASQAIGSSVPGFNLGQLRALQVTIPELSSQRAIAEVLGALDDKISANTTLNETASELAVALLAQYSPSAALADVVVHQKKSLSPTDFGGGLVAHYSLPSFDAGQRPKMMLPAEIKSSKFAIEQPCVLVSKLNPRFPRIWDVVELPKALAVSSTEFLVLESTCCSSTVLWAILSQPSFSAELESKVAGTSGSHQRVRPDDLLATEVIDPHFLPNETKTQIDGLGRRIALCRDESTVLATLRDALLPQLMSGKVRVRDAEQLVGDVV